MNRFDPIGNVSIRESLLEDILDAPYLKMWGGLTNQQARHLEVRANKLLRTNRYKTQKAKRNAARRLIRLVRLWCPEGLAIAINANVEDFKRTKTWMNNMHSASRKTR